MTERCPTCGQLTARRDRADERIEDIEFLLDAGESTDEIARRFGISRRSLARFLFRWGRSDLAVLFERRARCKSRAEVV